jgi:hypothetical protein
MSSPLRITLLTELFAFSPITLVVQETEVKQVTADKLHGLSLRANYTDRVLAKLVPTFADGGFYVVNLTDPYGRTTVT